MNGCLDRDFAFDHPSAGCALGLVADKDDVVFRVAQALFEVVDNAAAGAHAAAGDDNRRARDVQQLLMVLVCADGIKALEIEGVVAVLLEFLGVLVPKGFQACIDGGDLKAQGGIDKHRDVEAYPVQLVEQFLGSAQGKGGNIDNASIG